jgi:uncharacterized membrane protein HdeD (DUF308 family)
MSTNQLMDMNEFQSAVAKSVHDHWVLYLVEGIVLLALGLVAIVIPPLATLGVTIFLGWVLLISGIMGLVTTFWARHAPGFWWSLVSALLAVGAGLVLLAWPVSGAVSLTLVLIVFFVVEGIASIMFGLAHRQQVSAYWGWIIASGLVDLVLAAMIFAGLPGTAAWALGLLVGINMTFGGASMVAMALHARVKNPASAMPAA